MQGASEAVWRGPSSTTACVALIGAVLLWTYPHREHVLAITALSFWHYFLYWHAYRYGVVPLAVFKRDAVLMKTAALVALAAAYLPCDPDVISLVVVAAGFLLNCVAAHALGADRTYYGHEIAGLPPRRITAFPYSCLAHPMIVGNVLAYGGTMIDLEFRAQWWPLACAHVLLNLGLLWMEVGVRPLRLASRGDRPLASVGDRTRSELGATAIVFVLGGMLGACAGWLLGMSGPRFLTCTGLGACVAACALVIHLAYAAPAFMPRRVTRHEAEQRHD